MPTRAVEGLAERCDFSGFLGAVVAVGSHESVLKFELSNRGLVRDRKVMVLNDLLDGVSNLPNFLRGLHGRWSEGMKRLYARLLLWLIRPALNRDTEIKSAKISASLSEMLPEIKRRVTSAIRDRQG